MGNLTTERAQLRKLKDSNHFVGTALFRSMYFIWSIIKFFINPRHRSEQYSRIRYSKRIIQVSTYTKENRYPVLFKQIANELKDVENPKILSFGCSTGEEVLSIKKYIPNAEVTGVDINHWCIKSANSKNTYADCMFVHTSNKIWKIENQYDCILTLAVFQKAKHRNPDAKKTSESFRFHDFRNSVSSLYKLLKINGLFIIDNSDYKFTDLDIFKQTFQLEPYESIIRVRPTFNESNNKTSECSINSRVFRKLK